MHKSLAILLSLIALCLSAPTARAQFYTTGADPLGLHWLRLQGGGAGECWRISVDSAAWRWGWLASKVLERQANSLYSNFPSLAIRRRSVDVLVHSRHAYSNGLVTWAPRRLEAYSYNIGDDDCVPWVSHLMTHEYRHVLQTQSTIVGFSRFLYGLFGEQSTGLVLGLFVPRWYLEGDAVWAETHYTDGGRGRNPDFVQQMRALCLSGRTPSFGQAYFGSYATRVPDFYHMGYHMVSEASEDFGNDIFGRAVRKSGLLPFTFFPFQRSLRKQTGMRPMALYKHAMAERTAKWMAQEVRRTPTQATSLFTDPKFYQEATYFQPWDGGFVAYVTSPDFVSRFEVYDNDLRILRTFRSATREEKRFAVCGSKLVFSERRQHCRWANASESCLMMIDLSTGRKTRLTHGEDCHSPAFSPSGDTLACVLVGHDMAHSVVLKSRGVSKSIVTMPVGWQVPQVAWRDGSSLLLLVVNDEGRQIVSLDIESGRMTRLFGPRHQMIKDLAPGPDGRLYFTMNEDSTAFADVYSLGLADADLRREVVARHGAAAPVVLGDSLLVSLYGPDGYMPSVVRAKDEQGVNCVNPQSDFSLPRDTASADGFRKLGPMEAQVLPRVHSWGPVLVDADAQSVRPGIGLSSQNILGTVYWSAGYDFAPDDDAERVTADLTWDWLWPRIKLGGKWGHADYNYSYSYTLRQTTGGQTREYDIAMSTSDRSHISHLTLETTLPLTRNDGEWLRALTPSASFDWQRSTGLTYNVVQTESDRPSSTRRYQLPTADTKYLCSTFGLSSHIVRRAAENDVGYRFGVSFSAVYDRAVRHRDFGSMLTLSARLYLPGIGRHHQFLLHATAQNKWPGEIVTGVSGYSYTRMITDRVAAPYGLARVQNKQSALLRAAYTMPLCNPDWQWGPVAYVKRINLRLVGDYGFARLWNGTSTAGTSHRWSTSLELWAETRLATLTFPVSIGFRRTYLPGSRSTASTLLMSISFN